MDKDGHGLRKLGEVNSPSDAVERKSHRGVLIASCIFVVFVLAVLQFASIHSTPEGMFDEPRIGVERAYFLEFRDGKVFKVEAFATNQVGHYSRQGDQWDWLNRSGQEFRMSATLLKLHVVGPDGVAVGPFERLFFRPPPTAFEGRGR